MAIEDELNEFQESTALVKASDIDVMEAYRLKREQEYKEKRAVM